MALDKVEDVEIDADGVFKYILIEIKEVNKKSKQEVGRKMIVRGFSWAEYHCESSVCLYYATSLALEHGIKCLITSSVFGPHSFCTCLQVCFLQHSFEKVSPPDPRT